MPSQQVIGPYLQKLHREAYAYSALGIKVVHILF
jgi:hypothetical protein